MDRTTEVTVINTTGQAPMVPGSHFVTMTMDRSRPCIVDKRYLSEKRTARRLEATFADDFGLLISDNLWGPDPVFEAVYHGDGLHILSLRLSGNIVESVNENSYPLGAFTCSLLHYAPGVKHEFRLLPGEPFVEVCAVFFASFFMKKYRMTAAEVEAFLNPPHCRRLDPWFNQCRMTPQIEAIVHQLRGASPLEKTWRLFAEAKTLELVSLYLEQLQNGAGGQKRLVAAASDRQRLYVVREYLGKHFTQSPRIDELCRLAGLNRRKLTEGFKVEFGRTVYEYIRYLRMEHARALLQNGSTDINRVAQRVGYGHQGNFAKAFKQYLGVSPRQFSVTQRGMAGNKKAPRA